MSGLRVSRPPHQLPLPSPPTYTPKLTTNRPSCCAPDGAALPAAGPLVVPACAPCVRLGTQTTSGARHPATLGKQVAPPALVLRLPAAARGQTFCVLSSVDGAEGSSAAVANPNSLAILSPLTLAMARSLLHLPTAAHPGSMPPPTAATSARPATQAPTPIPLLWQHARPALPAGSR